MKKIVQKIFSVKNDTDKKHKILTLCGVKVKFRKKFAKNRKDYSLESGERQTATTLDEIRQDHINRYQIACNAISKYLDVNSTLKGLDMFCGNGYGSKYLADNLEAKIDSVDGSKEAIVCAKKYYKSKNIKYKCKLFPFGLKKNHYDFVTSLESIEHVKDDILFLKKIHSSLKDRGILVISTPNKDKLNLSINPNPFHYRHYSNNLFIELIKSMGFDFIEFYGQDVYKIDENGIIQGTLLPDAMELKSGYNGQFTIYIFRKKDKKEELIFKPQALIIDTTKLCNNNCSFCWRSNNVDYLQQINREIYDNTMSFDIYKKIIDDACKYESINWLSLCGAMGEPLLNEKIEDFYEYAYSKKHFQLITINTNGLAIDKKDVGRLLRSMTDFSVSVDSIDRETYKKIHGVDCLDKVIDNIKLCVEYKNKHKLNTNVIVRFTENQHNRGQIDDFIEFFKNIGVDYINYTKEHSFIDVNSSLYSEVTNLNCNQASDCINFNFLGDLTTCCVNWHLSPTFGNIKDFSLKQLWESNDKLKWNTYRMSSICKNCSGLGESQQARLIKLK